MRYAEMTGKMAKEAVKKKAAGQTAVASEKKKKVSARLVPAATRTIAILRLLAKSDGPLSLKQISSALNLVPSTCLHILRVLVDETLVTVDESSKRYELGFGVLTFASKVMRMDTVLGVIQREVEAISRKYNVGAIASRVERDRLYVVAVSIPRNVLTVHAQVGSRYPVYMGAAGVCYAAFSGIEPKQLYQRTRSGRWANEPQQAEWLAEVERCRKRGYAVDNGNYVEGVTMVTAPIMSQDNTISHTIGVAMHGHSANKAAIEEIGKALLTSASKARSF